MLMLLTLKTKFKKPHSCNWTVIITVNCQRNATKNIIFAKNSIFLFYRHFFFLWSNGFDPFISFSQRILVATCLSTCSFLFLCLTIFGSTHGSLTEGEGSVQLTFLLLTSLDQLTFIFKILFFHFYKTSYLNEEVNSTEPSPSVSIPCSTWYSEAFTMKTLRIVMSRFCSKLVCLSKPVIITGSRKETSLLQYLFIFR